ncbi:Phosphorylase superfamily protein [Propionibacterium cyclohexanicum]|uniref:Uridine phosphorylase n=1 Tax=Propionibacterium cyclohexanicum TaxID=64702 RepID=A0A1H9PKD2_9ACTN|nr:nucleoside phosphorylase [Propionibacterium cyclohexanicum]SER48644.1 Phosphorylase superfamily protein [Propionibacterium cyclohexanicum]
MLHTQFVPILERDDDPMDLIGDGEVEKYPADLFPSRALLAFLGEAVGDYAHRRKLPVIDTLDFVGNIYPVYRDCDEAGDFALTMMPVGAPAAVMVTDFLFRHGVAKAIAVGSCGALQDLPAGELLVPAKALRDEGTSYHYLKASRWLDLDAQLREHLVSAVTRAGYRATSAPVWTNDAFYRETLAMIRHRRAEGCAIVDMECSAMAACAALRGAQFAQLFYTADSLADPAGHDVRDWGRGSRGMALDLALSAMSTIPA